MVVGMGGEVAGVEEIAQEAVEVAEGAVEVVVEVVKAASPVSHPGIRKAQNQERKSNL